MSTQIPSHLLGREEEASERGDDVSRHVHFERASKNVDAPIRGTPIPSKMRAENEDGAGGEHSARIAKIALVIALLALLLSLFMYKKMSEFTKAGGLTGGGASSSNPYFAAVTRT